MKAGLSLKWLLAALVILMALGSVASVIYLGDAALSLLERLQRLPAWLGVAMALILAALLAMTGWTLWQLLGPRRARAASAPVVRSSIEARQQALAAQAPEAAAPVAAELSELDQRAAAARLYVALFGEINAGKSALLRALVPSHAEPSSARGGSTRQVRLSAWRAPSGAEITLADVPGFEEWQGEARAVAAREEALRSHLVLYVAAGDLSRSQWQEWEWLRGFGKPLYLVLNKTDLYNDEELAALRARLQSRSGQAPIECSAGGRESVLLRLPDGSSRREERERAAAIEPLQALLQGLARRGPQSLEVGRQQAVLQALDLKLDAAEQAQRRAQAEHIVERSARRAVLGALASVAPGSDLVIQGLLATQLLRELGALYGVSLRQLDVDEFIQLAGDRLRGGTAIVLAIAGNAAKAFPGLGTLGGGLLHAVAYGMIFVSLGRAVAETLERGHGLQREQALAEFDRHLKSDGEWKDWAPRLLRIALERQSEESGR